MLSIPRSKRHAVAVFLCLTTLTGCDSRRISELEEGVSTEADVRERFGEPAAIYQDVNGDVTLEYPRQPAGHVNYMISIGPDGKMARCARFSSSRSRQGLTGQKFVGCSDIRPKHSPSR